MSVDFLYFNWWTEGDDIWITHTCSEGEVQTWKAPTPWRLDGNGGITPSFDCKRCGRHSILRACDRIDPLTLGSTDGDK